MLRVEGLIRRAGSFTLAIDELEIPQGGYYVLVGPSGAGKTMLLETVAGLYSPDAGKIIVGGKDVTHTDPRERGIGFVYQHYWLFPHLTARDNILFGLRYRRKRDRLFTQSDNEVVGEMANILGIGHLLDRNTTTLSGGERQRIAVARALATQPSVLFLDEPLGPLDPLARESVATELKAWHDRFGTTTVHVTHDHAEACILANGIAVIADGRLVQCGPVDDVFSRPATPELARFLGCENILEGEVISTNGTRCTVQVGPVRFEAPRFEMGPVVACLRPEQITLANGAAPRDGYNTLRGRLTEIQDRGAVMRLVAEVDESRLVLHATKAALAAHGVQVGESVSLGFASESVHLISPPKRGRRRKKRTSLQGGSL